MKLFTTLRGTFLRALFVLVTLTVALLFCELFLRLVPIPGIQYDVSTYNDLTGHTLYPHSTYFYRNNRGDTATRSINSIGYLDTDHEKEKPNGTIRIGFFGDSFTEARQVELGATFFRLIENNLSDRNVETLAFGVSGFSTLQSYITYSKWGNQFDLDLVVYVFVENDPGDQIPELKLNSNIPYPILTENGFAIDNSFRTANAHKKDFIFRIGDYLTSRSLVLATVSQRLRFLLRYGIKLNVTDDDRWMAGKPDDGSAGDWTPGADDAPSTWPTELREQAKSLTEAVILQWSQEVESHSRDFVVFYVPRGREMNKPADQQDSWKLWLENFCGTHNILLLDPSATLIEAELNGEEVFYDHFTEDGHKAFAGEFVNWFQEAYRGPQY